MAEYIDREAFLKAKREQYCADCSSRKNSKGKMVYNIGDAPCRACRVGDMLDDVEDFPAADVVERKRGKWENTLQGWKCSACHKEQDYSVYFDFCPWCGADMRGEDDV